MGWDPIEPGYAALRDRMEACGIACGGAMRSDALIDAGAILALFHRTDRWHKVCVDAFQLLRLPLVTSEAVLTEVPLGR